MSKTPKAFVQRANSPVLATVFGVWLRRGSFIGPRAVGLGRLGVVDVQRRDARVVARALLARVAVGERVRRIALGTRRATRPRRRGASPTPCTPRRPRRARCSPAGPTPGIDTARTVTLAASGDWYGEKGRSPSAVSSTSDASHRSMQKRPCDERHLLRAGPLLGRTAVLAGACVVRWRSGLGGACREHDDRRPAEARPRASGATPHGWGMRCVNQAAAPAAITTTSATRTPTFVAALDFFSASAVGRRRCGRERVARAGRGRGRPAPQTAGAVGGAIAARMLGGDGERRLLLERGEVALRQTRRQARPAARRPRASCPTTISSIHDPTFT